MMISFDSKDGWYYRHWFFGPTATPERPQRHWFFSVLAFLAAGLSMSTRAAREPIG